MAQTKLWNNLAEEYDNQYHAITDWRLGYSVVESLLEKIEGKQILDYGCGSGKFSRRLRDLGAFVSAVDISDNAIERAKQKNSEKITYHVIEDDCLSHIEEDSLDHAVANFVLCCIQDKEKIRNIAGQIYEKLRPGGYFIICDPHPDSLGYEYISMKREKPEKVESGTPINVQLTGMSKTFCDYWRSKQDFESILKDSGLEVDKIIEPKIEDCSEEAFWQDEKIQAPLMIIRAKKPIKKLK